MKSSILRKMWLQDRFFYGYRFNGMNAERTQVLEGISSLEFNYGNKLPSDLVTMTNLELLKRGF